MTAPDNAPQTDDAPIADAVHQWLGGLFQRLQMDIQIELTEKHDHLIINLTGDDAPLLMDPLGADEQQPINAIHTLLVLSVFDGETPRKRITLDVNKRRQAEMRGVSGLADILRNHIASQRKSITVFGLNSQERKAIHMALSRDRATATESEGSGPFRRLKIVPR